MPRAAAGVRSARWKKYGPQARTLFREMNVPEELKDQLNYLNVLTQRAHLNGLISSRFPAGSSEYLLISRTLDVAFKIHGTRNRESGEREHKHLHRCFLHAWILANVRDANMLAATGLHDLSENFPKHWPIERVRRLTNETVAMYVGFLTKPTPRQLAHILGHAVTDRDIERYYYEVQLENAPLEVITIKACDVIDNLLTLWPSSIERMGRKIDDVVRWFLPLLRRHGLEELRHTIVQILDVIRHKLRGKILSTTHEAAAL